MNKEELIAEVEKYLKNRSIIQEDKHDLIIGFNDGSKVSLSELMQSFAEHYHEIKSKEDRINYIRLEAYKDKLEEWNNRDKAKIKELKNIIAYYENGTPLNKQTLKAK